MSDPLARSVAALNEFFGDPTWHLANWRRAAMGDLDMTPPVFNAHPAAILAVLAVVDAAMARVVEEADAGRSLVTLEAALTPTGDHHTLPDGYCLDCSGGCIVPLARENTEALRRAAYAKPDPFAVKGDAS